MLLGIHSELFCDHSLNTINNLNSRNVSFHDKQGSNFAHSPSQYVAEQLLQRYRPDKNNTTSPHTSNKSNTNEHLVTGLQHPFDRGTNF